MTAPAHLSSEVQSVSGSTWTLTAPAGIATGDLLVVQLTCNAGFGIQGVITPPTNWVQIFDSEANGSITGNAWQESWYYIVPASPPATWDFAVSSSRAGRLHVHVIDAGTFDATTPVEDFAYANDTGNDTSWPIPAVDAAGDALLIALAACAGSGPTWSPDAAYTERTDAQNGTTSSAGTGTRTITGGGSALTATWTSSASDNGSVSHIVIKGGGPSLSGYPAEVDADNPIAYWRLGEASGSILDSAGSTTGTANGTPTRNVAGLINATDDDGAIDFDGTDDYIGIPSVPAMGSTWSMEAWVRQDALGTHCIVSGNVLLYPQISTTGVGNVSVFWRNSVSAAQSLTSPSFATNYGYRVGEPLHVVATHTGNLTILYVNGSEVARESAQNSESYASATFDIGRRGTGSFFEGAIDEVALYDTALSATRVNDHYEAGVALTGYELMVVRDGAANYWRLGEAADDSSKNLLLNSSFENDNTNLYWNFNTDVWTIGHTPGDAWNGTKTARAVMASEFPGGMVSQNMAIDRSLEYRISFYSFLRSVSGGSVVLNMYQWDKNFVSTGAATEITISSAQGSWTRHDFRYGPTVSGDRKAFHADTAYIQLSFAGSANPMSCTWDVDGVQVEQSATLTAWEARNETWADVLDHGWYGADLDVISLGNGQRNVTGLITSTEDDGALRFLRTRLKSASTVQQPLTFTIEFWVKYHALASTTTYYVTYGAFPGVYISPNQKIVTLQWWDGFASAFLSSPADSLRSDTRYHVVITHDSTTASIYINGDLVASTDHDAVEVTGAGERTVGAHNFDDVMDGSRLTGWMDEFAIYATPLTAAQVEEHWLAGVGAGLTQDLTASLGFSAVGPINRTSRSIAASLSPSAAFIGGFARLKSLAGSLGFSGSTSKRGGKGLGGGISFTGILQSGPHTVVEFLAELNFDTTLGKGREFILVASDTILSFTGAFVKRGGKVVNGAITPVGSLVRSARRALNANLSPTGTFSTLKTFLRSLTATLTFTGAVVRRGGKNLTGAITPAGALAKRVARTLSASIAPSGALTKRTGKVLSGAITPAGALSRRAGKALSGAIAPSGALVDRFGKGLSAVLSFSGSTVKRTNRIWEGAIDFLGQLSSETMGVLEASFGATLSFSGDIKKRSGRAFNAALSFLRVWDEPGEWDEEGTWDSVSPLTWIHQRFRAFTAALTFSGALAKRGTRTLTGALLFSGAVTRRTARALTGSISPTGALVGSARKALAGTLTFSGAVALRTARSLAGVLSFAGEIGTAFEGLVTIAFDAALTFVGALNKRSTAFFDANLTIAGALVKRGARTFAASIGPAGALVNSGRKVFAASVSFGGALRGQAQKNFSAALDMVSHLMPGRSFSATLDFTVNFFGGIFRQISFNAIVDFATSFGRNSNMVFNAVLDFGTVFGRVFTVAFNATLNFGTTIASNVDRLLEAAEAFIMRSRGYITRLSPADRIRRIRSAIRNRNS